MFRSLVVVAALCGACATPEPEASVTAHELGSRELVAGDVYHYRFVLPVGSGPNARLAIHRVTRERTGRPRRAIVLMHGDFSSFTSNFLESGLAEWLAERDIDVWGFDRRWVNAPELDADVSDFATMGLDEELDDIGYALAFVRAVRLFDGTTDRVTLAGFSRGGQLAYYYAAREGALPALLRHVKGLVPIDIYPATDNEEFRQYFCWLSGLEYDAYNAGFIDGPNTFQLDVGRLALSAPDEVSPYAFFEGQTNRGVMYTLVGRTYLVGFQPTPVYHLMGPVIDGRITGLRYTSDTTAATWLAHSAPHQSMLEQAETDAMICGDAPPVNAPLSQIRVPLLLLGAAGGYGELGRYATTQVSSTDVTTHMVRLLPVEQEAEDFGHADMLFSPQAETLVWQPLLSWLNAH
jgi:pimeloyl-ACP methyl ester carboxylesterase